MAKREEKPKVEITYRKASHEYHFINEFDAGIMLTGTEVKSIRSGNANLSDAYCALRTVNSGSAISTLPSMNLVQMPTTHPAGNENCCLKAGIEKTGARYQGKRNHHYSYKLFLSERGLIKITVCLSRGKKCTTNAKALKPGKQARARQGE